MNFFSGIISHLLKWAKVFKITFVTFVVKLIHS